MKKQEIIHKLTILNYTKLKNWGDTYIYIHNGYMVKIRIYAKHLLYTKIYNGDMQTYVNIPITQIQDLQISHFCFIVNGISL